MKKDKFEMQEAIQIMMVQIKDFTARNDKNGMTSENL